MDPVCRAFGQLFLANEVEDAAKQQAILLSVCGSKTHALGKNLDEIHHRCRAVVIQVYPVAFRRPDSRIV